MDRSIIQELRNSRAVSFRHQKPCARRSQSHRFCCLRSSVSLHFGGLVYTPALLLQPLQAVAARHLQKIFEVMIVSR